MGTGWIIFIIATFAWHTGMYGMFKKAGIEAWKAFIPFYNTWCIVQKIELPKAWFFLQFIPIAGQFISIWITIKFVESFGRFSVPHHAAAVVIPFIYFPYMGFSKQESFVGKKALDNHKKPASREWIDAAAFAIVAATLIRTFVFEAYTIPTPSMEKTLLVDDYLFVNKFSYGPRLPNTPLAVPFVHNTTPYIGIKSYSELISLPYIRWFADEIKRNDVVVFNFPANDTLINLPEFGSKVTYYEEVRRTGREAVWQTYGDHIITRPVDKRENFIKRCVAVSGDTLRVINGQVYVDKQPQPPFPQVERMYLLKTILDHAKQSYIDKENLAEYGIAPHNDDDFLQAFDGSYVVNVTNEEKAHVHLPKEYILQEYISQPEEGLFPYYKTQNKWSSDNFGPIWIPKKSVSISLNADNIIRYGRCIEVYENNKLEEHDGKYFINDVPADTYTFKMNYYFMMGDNRHRSLDSRYWGFVPEDHIVGKASLVWFSWESGPRWKRFFNSIR